MDKVQLRISAEELAHLIANVPFNYALDFCFGGWLITTHYSWEYHELMKLREEKD